MSDLETAARAVVRFIDYLDIINHDKHTPEAPETLEARLAGRDQIASFLFDWCAEHMSRFGFKADEDRALIRRVAGLVVSGMLVQRETDDGDPAGFQRTPIPF